MFRTLRPVNQKRDRDDERMRGDKNTNQARAYLVVGNPAAFHAFKPPAMERTFL
jgi:hypothetical protein